MKKLLSLTFLFFSLNTYAQKQIVIQGANYTKFFTNLDIAISAANNGDKVYLPGGAFNSNIFIDKELHIIGAGYYLDSTIATFKTQVTAIYFEQGSDGSTVEGIYSHLNFATQTQNTNLSNIVVKRCFVTNASLNSGTSAAPNSFSNIVFIQNILGSVYCGNTFGSFNNIAFYNNIITNGIDGFNNMIVKNNIFSGYIFNFSTIVRGNNINIQNNIFVANPFWNITNSTLSNNIYMQGNLNGDLGSGIFGIGNILSSVPFGQLFVNGVFSDLSNVAFNFRLASGSPGHNAGTDGTDIGIYGGLFPWKEGGLPSNPHIRSQNIGGATDGNGKLKINIKVAAQDN